MLKTKTGRQVKMIVNNIAAACDDIDELKEYGYDYIYLAGGFIAHYDRFGFIQYYKRRELWRDIFQNAHRNTFQNFRPGDESYEYYRQKAEIYKMILDKIGGMI